MNPFSLETFLLGVLSLVREVTSSRGCQSSGDIRVPQKAFYNPNHWAPSLEPLVQGSGPGRVREPSLLISSWWCCCRLRSHTLWIWSKRSQVSFIGLSFSFLRVSETLRSESSWVLLSYSLFRNGGYFDVSSMVDEVRGLEDSLPTLAQRRPGQKLQVLVCWDCHSEVVQAG